ncbi:unnamed protein product, partial [Discosporangium mesarthrocarpum]
MFPSSTDRDGLPVLLQDLAVSPDLAMEGFHSRLECGLEVLRAGPTATEGQFLLLRSLISEQLPAFVEAVYRRSMSERTAELAAALFASVQDFIDACLKSQWLDDGPHFVDLSPLVHVLHLLMSTEDVPCRFPVTQGTDLQGQFNFNRDHGKPRIRAYKTSTRYFWPDDWESLRVGAEAVGWCVEVLDTWGDFASYLSDTEENASGAKGSTGDSAGDVHNPPPETRGKWVRVVVLDGPMEQMHGSEKKESLHISAAQESSAGTRGARPQAGAVWTKRRQAAGEEGTGLTTVDTLVERQGGLVEEVVVEGSSISGGVDACSAFRVRFESGRTAVLDLSRLNLRWIEFSGPGGGGDAGKDTPTPNPNSNPKPATKEGPGNGDS